MYRMKRCRRSNPVHAPVLLAALRAERGEAPLPVRRRRRRLISDQGLAYTVYAAVLGFAAVVVSLAYGLVTAT